jgi:Transglutaminase-like superfamily
MGAIARYAALSPRDRRLAIRAAAALGLAAIGVRCAGVQRMLRSTEHDVRGGLAGADDVRDLVAAIDRASRYVPGGTCLPRAIALTWMLRRRGIAAIVRLGARSQSGAFKAHAWVEYNGAALNDPEIAEQYSPI